MFHVSAVQNLNANVVHRLEILTKQWRESGCNRL